MQRVSIVPAQRHHIPEIVKHVRQADIDEFFALSMSTPREVLDLSLRVSKEAWTGCINDVPVVMFGVTSLGLLSDAGVPWLVGTDALEVNQKVFLRRSIPALKTMLFHYSKLENYVYARNLKAIEWLKWLGFTIEKPKPYGAFNKPFHHFYLKKD